MIMEYLDLLKKANEHMPKSQSSGERFEIPKVNGHIQGNKTIVNIILSSLITNISISPIN